MNTKKIGVFTGLATAVGVALGSTAFVSLGKGAGYGGQWFVYAIMLVGIVYLCFALSACELNDILPGCKGNAGRLLARAFGPSISIVLNIMTYFIISVVAGSAETIFVSRVISNTMLKGVPYQVIAVCLLLIVLAINLVGVDMFAKVQNFVFVFLVVTLFMLAIVGSFGLSSNVPMVTDNIPSLSGVSGVLELSSWAYYLFLAIDMVLPLACTMKNPKKNIRISLIGGILMLMVLYSLLSYGLYRYLPLEILAVDSMPNVTFGNALFGNFGYYWMIIAVIFAAVSTENSLVLAPSVDLQGCANSGLFPKFMGKTNRFGSAYPWIIMISVCQIIICTCFGNMDLDLLIMVACGFYIVVFILFHVAAIKFRILYPNANRNKKYVLFHIPQIIGIVGLLYIEYTVFQDWKVLVIDIIVGVVTLTYATLWCKYGLKEEPFKASMEYKIEEAGSENTSEETETFAPVIAKRKNVGTDGHVITISREFGSLGRPIAEKVAEKLNYQLYDPQLIEMAAAKLNKDVDDLLAYDDQKVIKLNIYGSKYCGMAYPLGFGDNIKQRRLFEIQSDIIRDIATKENAVIVGRAADYVLTKAGKKDMLRIHITGSYEHRYKNSIEELELSEVEAKEHIRIIDKAREEFYKQMTGEDFDSATFRDVVINTDLLSVDYIVDMICDMAQHKFA